MDSANKYHALYHLEVAKSSGYAELYAIEKGKTARADSLLETRAHLIDRQTARADKAEAALGPVTAERDKLKGKTWVGQKLRKARDGLAILGGTGILIGALKLFAF